MKWIIKKMLSFSHGECSPNTESILKVHGSLLVRLYWLLLAKDKKDCLEVPVVFFRMVAGIPEYTSIGWPINMINYWHVIH